DEDLKNLLSSGRGRFVGRIESFQQLPHVIRSVRKSIPLLWAGGLENHSDVLREISKTRSVIGADPDIVEQLRDPWTVQRWLSEAVIESPRLATESTADANCSWLRKSVASSGGIGIGLLHRPGWNDGSGGRGWTERSEGSPGVSSGRSPTPSTHQCTSDSPLQRHDVYLQEYIDGVPMSATFCSDESGLHLLGMCLQLIGWPCLGASNFLFCGNLGPVDVGEEITKQVLAIARVLVDRSGIRGVFGIDFIMRQGKVWLLEVNPRLTASHMLFELQQPGLLVQRHLAALGWKSSKTRRTKEMPKSRLLEVPTPVSARLIFWAKQDVEFSPHREPQGASRRFPPIRLADCPQPGSVVAKSSPLCSLHVTASDFESIERQLTALEAGPGDEKNSSIAELFKTGFSTQAIAGQLRLLRQKFERNCG
ncbi:MAG TPA: ATP-grasp domain-containing protein, partial [Planctomycetaceae bacterium]|nr:ATP-grasp domain-containing protein [Planctomycetaceae bacterium]